MARPKRNLLATAQATSSPPASLDDNHAIACVRKAEGKNLYLVKLPKRPDPLLVEMPARFRSQIWVKPGGYVLIDTAAFLNRDNKLDGEIVNVVREEKEWRKQSYWCIYPLRLKVLQLKNFLGRPSLPRSRHTRRLAMMKNPRWGRCHRATTLMVKNEPWWTTSQAFNQRACGPEVLRQLSSLPPIYHARYPTTPRRPE